MSSTTNPSLIDQIKSLLDSIPVINKFCPTKSDNGKNGGNTTNPAPQTGDTDGKAAGDVSTPAASQLFGLSRDGLRGRIVNRVQRRMSELQNTVVTLNPLAEQKLASPKGSPKASTPKSVKTSPAEGSVQGSPKATSPAMPPANLAVGASPKIESA